MKSKWITHKDKKIMYCNYANFGIGLESLQIEINAVDEIVCGEPENSVLVLVDVRNTTATTEVVELFKQSSARTTHHLKKVAGIGITGIRRVLLDIVTRFSGQDVTLFEDIEAAKDWLVED